MEAKRLFLADGKPVDAALCGKCGRVWESNDAAERCCRCGFCGKHCDWSRSVSHEACYAANAKQVDQERLLNAVLVEGYDGPFLIGERFCGDSETLLDWFSPEQLPEFGWCLTEQPAHIDIGSVIDSVREEMHEGWEEEPCEELEAGVAAWNKANEGNSSWFECDDRKWSRAAVLRIREARERAQEANHGNT